MPEEVHHKIWETHDVSLREGSTDDVFLCRMCMWYFLGKAPLLENVMFRILQEAHCNFVVNTLGGTQQEEFFVALYIT